MSKPYSTVIMESRVSIITLGVSDLAQSTDFYQNGLGLPLLPSSTEGISFFAVNGGSLWLALYPRDLLAEDARVPAEGSGFRGFTVAHNVRTREAVHEVMEQAVRAGARLVKEPQEVFWGGYSGYFADLDGFLWEVAHNPFNWIE
jgi:uncharacterized protein